ncbi:MAG TPA: response regulator [Candidatus Limnocylindria bacterium]
MSGRILAVEDDEATRQALRALLEDAGYLCAEAPDGESALSKLSGGRFDLVLLDLGLPGISGAEVYRRLQDDPRTRFLPIIFLTARSQRQEKLKLLEAGAEDFMSKPYDADELLARVHASVRRWTGLRAANPLSGLPGNTAITEEIETRLARGDNFALLYVDIDRFKEFNDHYGFTRGDRVISMLSELLVQTAITSDRFVGHVGGDDFVVLAKATDAESLAECITRRFDESISRHYDADDSARGWIEAHDRRGRLRRIPLATVSIGIVSVPPGRFDGATSAARAAAEVKEVAKRRRGSAWAVDRRRA